MLHKFHFIALATTIFTLFLAGCHRDKVPGGASPKILRMATSDFPDTLDPRKSRVLSSATTGHLFFEGLMPQDGDAYTAVASSVDISSDGLTYTFHLRPCLWSNHDAVTAYDFEYSWKTVLSPDFPAPNAYYLYVIRGAKEAKAGKLPLSDVAVVAVDDHTLRVTLEAPCPLFLKLVALPPFLPVNKRCDVANPGWAEAGPKAFVGNGPFTFSSRSGDELVASKNESYWDANNVKLDGVVLVVQDDNTALQLFQSGQLDWVGSPLGCIPVDAIVALKNGSAFHKQDAAGTAFFRFNTASGLYSNASLRKAFNSAIDRQSIVDSILQGGQKPATTLVPSHWTGQQPLFHDNDKTNAVVLFEQALQELHLDRDHFPNVTLMYSNEERSHKLAQAVQQQWQATLHVPVTLRKLEGKVLIDSIRRQDYQIALGSWFADVADPSNFLEVFRSRHNGTNNTGWEDTHFAELLDIAMKEGDTTKRLESLKEAETCLLEAMPIAPIFQYSFLYLVSPHVKGVKLSETGSLDFKDAYLDEAGR